LLSEVNILKQKHWKKSETLIIRIDKWENHEKEKKMFKRENHKSRTLDSLLSSYLKLN